MIEQKLQNFAGPVLLIMVLLLVGGGIFARRFLTAPQGSVIGEILSVENDVRLRRSRSLNWQSANPALPLYADDVLYTEGEARAQIRLKSGAELDLSENTLITFSTRDGEEMPKLERGNLRLSLQGALKFILGGRQVQLVGQDSDMQIFIEEPNPPRLRLFAGKMVLHAGDKEFELLHGKVASLDIPDLQTPLDPMLIGEAEVKPLQNANEYFYIDKLTDIYQPSAGVWSERPARPIWVTMSVPLNWKIQGLPTRTYGQLAQTRDYAHPLTFQSVGDSYTLTHVFLGDNYWRVSADGRNWQEAYFKVTGQPANFAPPHMRITNHRLKFSHGLAQATFPMESSTAFKAYLVEISPTPIFINGKSQIRWVTTAKFNTEYHQPGEYYYRVRGVRPSLELSDFSEIQRVNVVGGSSRARP